MSKNGLMYLFKYEKHLNLYVFQDKVAEDKKASEKSQMKGCINHISKIGINMFSLPLDFGIELKMNQQ
jgi:hypothetical protein